MERHEILDAMSELKLYGMRASFDEIAGKGLARRDEIYPLIASLIRAERTHRQARSISYRIGGAKFPVLKDIDKFVFADTPVREAVALRSHRHRRTRLSAVQPTWRPVVVPPDQQTLRKHLAADHHQSGLRRLATSVRRRQNDNRHARSADPPLRHHRDRQRQLALQEPRITSCSPLAARQDRLCSAMWGSAPPVSAPSEAKHSHTAAGSSLQAKRGRGWKRFDNTKGYKRR